MNISNKKILALIISLIFILILIISLLIVNFNTVSLLLPGNNEDKLKQISESVKQEGAKYERFILKKKYDENLKKINNTNLSDKERYDALELNIGALNNAYGLTNDPELRNFILLQAPFIKKAFPEYYQDTIFNIACADPECGEKIDPNLLKLINQISILEAEKGYVDTILLNLNIAAFIPTDTEFQKFDKFSSFNLSYNQLLELNNKQASSSAEKLKTYVKAKYNEDLYEIN